MITLHTKVVHSFTNTEVDCDILSFDHFKKEIVCKWKLANGSYRYGTFNTKNGKCFTGDACGGWELALDSKMPYKLHYDGVRASKKARASVERKERKLARAAASKVCGKIVSEVSDERTMLEKAKNLKKDFKPDE